MTARTAFSFLTPVVVVAVAAGSAFLLSQRGGPSAARVAASHAQPEPVRKASRLADPDAGPALTTVSRTVQEGLSVALRLGHLDPKRTPGSPFREGDDVVIGLEIRDATTELPVTKARPAAWLVADDEPGEGDDPRKTASLVKALIEARFMTQAKLDLNVYYVLTLNEDSVSVVDPLYGFGGMKLLALLPLGGKGYDWAFAEDRNRLFVSVPETNSVVAIDTQNWSVLTRVPTPPRPTRLAVQPDGEFVWVACDGPGGSEAARAVCIDVEAPRVVATAGVGTGPHDLAFSDDSRYLIVSNDRGGTVTVVEVAHPAGAVALRTGRRPVSVAYSAQAGQAWVAHAGDGRIVTIDPARRSVTATIPTNVELAHIRFSPDGRHALAVSPATDRLVVLDVASARAIQRGKIDGGPDRVMFTDGFAYVRRRTSPMLRAIPLEGLGYAGRELPEMDLPMGSGPLGRFRLATPADSIVPVPGGGAVLVVNSEDKSVHYHKEGMSAPMGSFRLRNGYPRATLTVDRSLQERHAPGLYETAARLPEAAAYKVVFYLDTPRIIHSFPLRAEPDPELAGKRTADQLAIAFPEPPRQAKVGEPVTLRFLVTERTTKTPRPNLSDLRVQTLLAPGILSDWHRAEPKPGGWYEVQFRPVKAGVYYLFFESATVGLEPHETDRHVLHVREYEPQQKQAGD